MTAAIVISIIGLIIQGLYVFFEKQKIYNRSLPLKVLASSLFFLVGFIGFLSNDFDKYNLFIVLGLFFGIFGDFFLSYTYQVKKENKNKVYATGIISFLIGHIFYTISLIIVSNNILISIIIGIALSLLAVFFILRSRKFSKIILIVGIIYITVLLMMFSFSVVYMISVSNTRSYIFYSGSTLFVLSDLIIVYNTFGEKKSKLISSINHFVYYIAQLLIAFTILF